MAENLKLKQGSYWAYKKKDGRQKEKKLHTTNKATAKQRRDQWFKQLDAEEWGERPIPTVQQAARTFIEDHLPNLKPSSARRYETSMLQLIPFFGHMKISDIEHEHLLRYEKARKRTVTQPTIRRDLACLSSIYSMCEDLRLTEKRNPIQIYLKRRLKQKALMESQPRTRYLSEEEERELLKHSSDILRPMIEFAIDTGLRRSEQFLLKMENVNLDKAELIVTANISKNRKARTVPIKQRTLAYLKMQANREYAFMSYHNKPYSIKSPTVYDGLQKAARKCVVQDIRWHDLRRTCACRLLNNDGFFMHEVRDWLGHSSLTTTEKAYAFLRHEKLKEKIQALEYDSEYDQSVDF